MNLFERQIIGQTISEKVLFTSENHVKTMPNKTITT